MGDFIDIRGGSTADYFQEEKNYDCSHHFSSCDEHDWFLQQPAGYAPVA